MNSRGFYSFYVFVLIVFIALALTGYFSSFGRAKIDKSQDHILMQMEIFSKDLLNLGKECVKKYSLNQCQVLFFDLEGYMLKFFIQQCQEEICLVDVLIERLSPFSSLPMRYSRREIWNLKNLKKSRAH